MRRRVSRLIILCFTPARMSFSVRVAKMIQAFGYTSSAGGQIPLSAGFDCGVVCSGMGLGSGGMLLSSRLGYRAAFWGIDSGSGEVLLSFPPFGSARGSDL
jgi:hypothetical protein